jgi:hypothetical protein
MAASLQLCPVRDAHSSLLDLIGTPSFERTLLHLGTMCDTNSTLFCLIGTSLEAAMFLLSAMSDTNSSLLDTFVTSLEAAKLMPLYCAMGDTNSSILGKFGTSNKAALLVFPFVCLDIWLRFFQNRLILQTTGLLLLLLPSRE